MDTIKNCLHCNSTLPEDRRSDSHYCSEKCRTAAKRLRKKNKKTAKKIKLRTLNGVEPGQPVNETPKQPEKPVQLIPKTEQPENNKPKSLLWEDMPPLRNYIADANGLNLSDIPNPPIAPPEFDLPQPEPIQKQVRDYTVTIKNPLYIMAKGKTDRAEAAVTNQQAVIENLEKQYKETEQSKNTTLGDYFAGATIGGASGYSISSSKNWAKKAKYISRYKTLPKKFDESENTGWSTFWGAVLGISAVKLKDVFTIEIFEKKKKETLAMLSDKIHAERDLLDKLTTAKDAAIKALRSHRETIEQPRTEFLNKLEYEQREAEIAAYNKSKEAYQTAIQNYEQTAQLYIEKYGSLENVPKKEQAEPLVKVDGVVSSTALNDHVGGVLLLKGYWREFIGMPSRDFKLIVHGVSGGGKSHLMLQFGHYLAVHHGTVLYNTSEEKFSTTFNEKLERLAAKTPGFDIGKMQTADEIKAKIPRNVYNFIILDSVSDMGMDAEDLSDLRQHFCCSAVLGIFQNTKGGDIRGSNTVIHDSDIKLRVEEKGAAYTDKNRFLEAKPEFNVFQLTTIPASMKSELPEGYKTPEQNSSSSNNKQNPVNLSESHTGKLNPINDNQPQEKADASPTIKLPNMVDPDEDGGMWDFRDIHGKLI